MTTTDEKERRLREILAGMGGCLVAFSGGVDSAYLAVVAHHTLGKRSLAVTAESPSYPAYQKDMALDVVARFGLRHEFIRSEEMSDPRYARNPVNRCYYCKHELYQKLGALAEVRGFGYVLDGNNLDDTGDYRPGRQAGAERSVRSPLIEAGLGKEEVRALSRSLGLPTWDLPASACLSSRIPYGSPVTEEKLQMIENGESVLRSLGFRQSRVRHHGEIARIEIPRDELSRALEPETCDRLVEKFRELGFRYVTLDLEGYRSGRLNESAAGSRAPNP